MASGMKQIKKGAIVYLLCVTVKCFFFSKRSMRRRMTKKGTVLFYLHVEKTGPEERGRGLTRNIVVEAPE